MILYVIIYRQQESFQSDNDELHVVTKAYSNDNKYKCWSS